MNFTTSAFRHPGAARAACFAIAAIAASCHKAEAAKSEPPFSVDKDSVTLAAGTPRPVSFATAKAEMGSPLPPPPVTGRVATVETLTSPAFSPLAGHVAELAVRLGDHVKPGDKLVRIRTQDLSTLHHDLASASLAIKTKQAIVDRTKILVENHAATQNDLLVAESELDEAKLAAASAGAKIESLSVEPVDATSFWLLATRAGTVVDLDVTPGQEVGPDKDKPVVTVASLDELLVIADVRPRDAKAVPVGAKVTVGVTGSNATTEGTVETVSEVVDPDRQTVPVRIRVANGDHVLMPNAFVDVTFSAAPGGQALLVPSQAVVSDGADSVVFVETESGKFQRREVRLGRQGKASTEITGGISAGDSVVVEGALLLLNSLDAEG